MIDDPADSPPPAGLPAGLPAGPSADTSSAAAVTVLPTKLEEDFIAPVTAIRGALEILRDFPDLSKAERQTFVSAALAECSRIEHGLNDLSAAVYSGERPAPSEEHRVALDPAAGIAELDFADLTFDSAERVNAIFDRIETQIAASERRWWFLVDFTGCHVFPEAWIAFAHRGKKLRVEWGFGTIRFNVDGAGGLPGRGDALAEITAAKARI